MQLPFTSEEFLKVFRNYNEAVFPMQIVFYLLALLAVYYTTRKKTVSDRLVTAILGFFWLWMGLAYHLLYFTSINKAAYLFGGVFILQGLLFLYVGIIGKQLSFSYPGKTRGIVGALLITYALIIYPVVGSLQGHAYPAGPTFGLPCPTTIFTFGLLLWADRPVPKFILIIPLLWSLIGFSAALTLGIKEDYGLLLAGILAGVMIFWRKRSIA